MDAKVQFTKNIMPKARQSEGGSTDQSACHRNKVKARGTARVAKERQLESSRFR